MSGKARRYAVLVIAVDGRSSYVCDGESDQVSTFWNKPAAERTAKFWRDGLGDEVQSVNVVRHPDNEREGVSV